MTGLNEAVYDIITNEAVINRDTILQYSVKHKVCPYEMSLDVSYWCDGIICDYNYAFDPDSSLKRYFGDGGKGNYVFLVDDMGNNTYVKLLPDYSTRPDKPVIRAGYNITASLDGETLTLSGTGETYDNLWWADSDDNEIIKSNVKYIVVEDGITALGYELFKNFNNVETIELPASLTKIKNWTFQNCRSLKAYQFQKV